jgi:hypothetical protein
MYPLEVAAKDSLSWAFCSLEELVKALIMLNKFSPRAWMLPGLKTFGCIRGSV